MDEKVSVLFISANPVENEMLHQDEELRGITEELVMSERKALYKVESIWAARGDDVVRAVLRLKPHVIHFSGHGRAGDPLLRGIHAADPRELPVALLAQTLQNTPERVSGVVLNCCDSGQQAAELARAVPWVVAMTRPIADSAAIQFAIGFYRALFHGSSVAQAVHLGKTEIKLKGHNSQGDIPMLFTAEGVDAAKLTLPTLAPLLSAVAPPTTTSSGNRIRIGSIKGGGVVSLGQSVSESVARATTVEQSQDIDKIELEAGGRVYSSQRQGETEVGGQRQILDEINKLRQVLSERPGSVLKIKGIVVMTLESMEAALCGGKPLTSGLMKTALEVETLVKDEPPLAEHGRRIVTLLEKHAS